MKSENFRRRMKQQGTSSVNSRSAGGTGGTPKGEMVAWCFSLLKIRDAHVDKTEFTRYYVGSRAERNVPGYGKSNVKYSYRNLFGFVTIENKFRGFDAP